MNDTKQSTEDLAILEQLNNDYVHSDPVSYTHLRAHET